MENSKIAWTDHTFNPWIGCEKVSPACDNCYAERDNKRYGRGELFTGAPPIRTSAAYWKKPLKWNRDAEASGKRQRVFCASWADVFDDRVPKQWRLDLWALIAATPNLDWLILTKRPQNIMYMLPDDWNDGYTNVWIGVTAENREQAVRRIPILRSIPAAVRFISCEPLLEDITPGLNLDGIHWVICGGESGYKARYMQHVPVLRLIKICRTAGVSFFMKQMGSAWDKTFKDKDKEWGNA